VPDDVKKRLFFLQSDNELLGEVQARFEQSEGFLVGKIKKLETENNILKERVAERDAEIKVIKRDRNEIINISIEN
jgi:hypothetical protein